MSGHAVTSASAKNSLFAGLATLGAGSWTTRYLRLAALADIGCGLLAGLLAFQIRFDDQVGEYLAVSLALPLVWVATVALSGANDIRFVGVGTDEFRRVLNAGVFLIAAVAILSYAFKAELARGYVVIALPSLTAFDLLARFALRRACCIGREARVTACAGLSWSGTRSSSPTSSPCCAGRPVTA